MKYIPGIIIGILTNALFWVLYTQSGDIVGSISITMVICISLVSIVYILGHRKKE